jgi:hypothetical protein
MNFRSWYATFMLGVALLFGAGAATRAGLVTGYAEEKSEKEFTELAENKPEGKPSTGLDKLPPPIDQWTMGGYLATVNTSFYDIFYCTLDHAITYGLVCAIHAPLVSCKKPGCGLEVLYRLLLI